MRSKREAKISRTQAKPDQSTSSPILEWLFSLTLWLLPLVIFPACFDFQVLPKLIFLRILTVIILFLLMLDSLKQREIEWRRTPLDLPIILLGATLVLSTVFGLNPHISFYGLRFRYDGILTIFNYFLIFCLTVNLIKSQKQLERMLFGILISASLVSVYSIAQRFGAGSLTGVVLVDPARASATFGSPLFLGGYLALIFPVALTYLLVGDRLSVSEKALVSAAIFLIGAALVLTLTRSAWLGVAVSALFIIGWALQQRKLNKTGLVVLVLILVLIAGVFQLQHQIVGGPSLTGRLRSIVVFSRTSADRLLIWQASLFMVRDFPVLGTGPDGFGLVFVRYRPANWSRTVSNPQTLADKAHNDLLQTVVTAGLPGLIFYLSIFITFGWFCLERLKRIGRKEESAQQAVLITAIVAAVLSGLVQLQFSFTEPSVTPFLWALMGMGVSSAYLFDQGKTFRVPIGWLDRNKTTVISLAGGLIAGWLIYTGLIVIWADAFYQKAFSLSYAQRYSEAAAESFQAARLNPGEFFYFWELAFDSWHAAALEGNSDYFKQSLAALGKAKELNPMDRLIYYGYGEVFRSWGAAVDRTYLNVAINSYKKALKVDPEFTDAWRGLARAEEVLGHDKAARLAWKKILQLNPADAEAKQKLVKNKI